MKEIWIDVETTGTNPHKNGIIQLSGIIITPPKYEGSHQETRFDFKMQPFPNDEVVDSALASNNLTLEQIAGFEPPAIVYAQFIALMSKHINRYDSKDKFFFYAYNSRFDEDMLRAWFQKNNDRYYGSWFFTPSIDVMALAADYLKDIRKDMPNFKQGTVARYLGIDVQEDKLHDAMYDIEITQKIYREVKTHKNQKSSNI